MWHFYWCDVVPGHVGPRCLHNPVVTVTISHRLFAIFSACSRLHLSNMPDTSDPPCPEQLQGQSLPVLGCGHPLQPLTPCKKRKRCQQPGCKKSARSATDFCIEHGGGKRCEIAAAHLEPVLPPAYYRAANKWHCWGCFVALHPDLAMLKVRKEHYVVAELQGRLSDIFATAAAISWDCPVAGGCTLLRPDLLVRFAGLYLQVEVDEHGHQQKGCAEEDTRLSLIAADVGLPGVVLRVNPDQPSFECFRKKALSNGEVALECTKHFKPLLDKAEDAIRKALATPPSSVIQLFVDANPDTEVQTSRPW